MGRYQCQWFAAFAVILISLVAYSSIPERTALGADSSAQATWSKADAASYLDRRSTWWIGWNGAARGGGTACISCHTTLPIALAQPAVNISLGQKTPGVAEQALVDNVTKRVATWNTIVTVNDWSTCTAYYTDQKANALGTESIMNALVLVNNDERRDGGVLSPQTQAALTYLWQQEQPNGSWDWIEFGLRPWEGDSIYYGTALAALTVGMAGKGCYNEPDLQPKIALLKQYLTQNLASRPLHDQAVCLWASTYLPGFLTPVQQQQLTSELLTIQDSDGGWSLTKLGVAANNSQGWPTGGMYPAGSISDGFATGLVVVSLKRLGIPEHNPSMEKAVAWLSSSEVDGSWPTNYINGYRDPQSDMGGFMRDASTSFAVLALTTPSRK